MDPDTSTPFRNPGDPLSAEFIRRIRDRNNISQEELARRLGVRGGKSVVSAWETGRSPCEGPAAELLLRVFADTDGLQGLVELEAAVDREWSRTGSAVDTWRQVLAVPVEPLTIERSVFAELFPGTEVPEGQHAHGFPFLNHGGLPNDVFGVGPGGWRGSIPPSREHAPQYLWQLQRGGQFAYRQVPWELAPNSITSGHTHVGSLIELVLNAVVFIDRLAKRINALASGTYALQLDLHGMRRWGIVGSGARTQDVNLAGVRLSAENHLVGRVTRSLTEIGSAPSQVTYDLVGEVVIQIDPKLATNDELDRQLRVRLQSDKLPGSRIRFLGAADALLEKSPTAARSRPVRGKR